MIINNDKQNTSNKYIYIKESGIYIKLKLKDIMYLSSNARKVTIYTKEKLYSVYDRMIVFDKILSEFDFIRTHQSYLINSLYIKCIGRNFIIMCDNSRIPISRKYNNICKWQI